MLLSSLAANGEEGSLHCHDVLIAIPLRERAQEKRDGPRLGAIQDLENTTDSRTKRLIPRQ